jgi:hypothetical protein
MSDDYIVVSLHLLCHEAVLLSAQANHGHTQFDGRDASRTPTPIREIQKGKK